MHELPLDPSHVGTRTSPPSRAHVRRARPLRRLVGAGLALGVLAPVAAAASPAAATPAVAAPVAAAVGPVDQVEGHEVLSPDGSLDLTLGVVDGRLTYDVVRDGTTTVVGSSGLGFVLDGPDVDLTAGMSIESVERDVVDETWTPAWGTQSSVENHANELTVHARHESGLELDVVVRVFDDGIGLRYVFPQQPALDEPFVVTAERTEFALSSDLTAYYIRAGRDWSADEKHYMTTAIGNVPNAQTPITFSRDDGLFLAVHEADLTDYPSMTLVRGQDRTGTLVSDLVALPDGTKAVLDVREADFATPWRTVQVGREAGDLAESHLVLNLNDPCAICDVDSDGDGTADTADWIEPGTYTGVWWELQRRHTTWNAGPNHGATTERIKEYVDLAAEAGARYVLAEGWNTNSGGSWTNQDFVTPQADVDIEEVLAYAEAHGVGFVAHNETRGYVDYYDAHMEEIFAQYEEWGIHAIKSGYATRFELGGVNRSHYDQEAVKHYQRVIEAAARHEITINAHEAIKPTGKERTYPNMMTGEGVAGMEQHNYMGSGGNPPEQATILPFTRWIGGPADYTPGVLDVLWDPANLGTRVQTTTTTQLALYTTFYSPLQMLADTPENYAKHPEAFEYLRDIPATWDESHVDAEIGDHVTTARRSGDDWYVGVVTDENDRTLDVPLDMLDDDVTYVAEVWADAQDASWKGNPTAVEVTRSLVTSDDVLSASLVGAGGQAVRLRPATAADLESLEPYARPSLEVVGSPAATFDPVTRTVQVSVDVRNTGTSVTEARLVLDGEAVGATGTAATRVGGGQTRTLTFSVESGSVPYAATTAVAFATGTGETGPATDVQLVPFPDGAALGALIDAARTDGGLSSAAARVLDDRVDAMVAAAEAGDLASVERAAQSIRTALVSRGPGDVDGDTLEAIDAHAARWLGERVGLPALLAALRAEETAGRVEPGSAAAVRAPLAAALRAAVRGDNEVVDRTLGRAAEAIATAQGDPAAVESLLAAVDAQRTELVLEAENGTLAGGAITTTEHPGYTGTGFVRTLSRENAAFTVDAGVAPGASYDVSFRYANGMVVAPLDRQLSLTVGGEVSRPLTFPNLGQDADRWRRWGYTEPVRVTFGDTASVGLRYAAGDTGHVNVDHVLLVPTRGVLVVPASQAVDVTVDAEPRCLGSRAYLALRALNAEDVPVDLALTLGSRYGERSFGAIAPGASAYQTFAMRSGADEASTATVVVRGELGGERLDTELTVDVPAISCA